MEVPEKGDNQDSVVKKIHKKLKKKKKKVYIFTIRVRERGKGVS